LATLAFPRELIKADAANDQALLKAEGRFAALPVAASRGVKLGGTVAATAMVMMW
jgi:S1-C subfamily serine protease